MLLLGRLKLLLVSNKVVSVFSLMLLLVSADGRGGNGWRDSQKPSLHNGTPSVCYPSVQISKLLCMVAQKG